MSRTIRRKGTPLPDWYKWDWEWVRNDKGELSHLMRVRVSEEELKAAKIKYHSDKGHGEEIYSSSPKWFRKDIERNKRAKDKAELRRINKEGDYEEYSFTPRRKDAGWLWW